MSEHLTKRQAIGVLLGAAGCTPTVFTTGYACRIAQSIDDRDDNFYMVGSMGLAAVVGAGLARALERPVLVADGDGGLLMNLSCLAAIGAMDGVPLVHAVLDDGRYDSTGGQPTSSRRHDLAGFARAAGYRTTCSVESAENLRDAVREAIDACQGPAFIHCRLAHDTTSPGPRITVGLREHAARFRSALTSPAAAR